MTKEQYENKLKDLIRAISDSESEVELRKLEEEYESLITEYIEMQSEGFDDV